MSQSAVKQKVHNAVRFSGRNVDALADEVDNLRRAMDERERELSRSPKAGRDH